MVLSYYQGREIYPDQVAQAAFDAGGWTCGSGVTNNAMFDTVSRQYNMSATGVSWDDAMRLLDQKAPILINVTTYGGHFLVATQRIGDTIYINDSDQGRQYTESTSGLLGRYKGYSVYVHN